MKGNECNCKLWKQSSQQLFKCCLIKIAYSSNLKELRDKTADKTEWQSLMAKIRGATGEVEDCNKSSMEAC